MNCCCTNTLDFCRQGICGDGIDFDILAQVSGVHTLLIDFLGIQISVLASFEVGDKIIFPTNLLNENYQYTGNIFDPNGAKILIRKNDIDYDCFKFLTTISLNAQTGEASPGIDVLQEIEIAATFALISAATNRRLIYVTADETNNGDTSLYLYTGTALKFLQTVS